MNPIASHPQTTATDLTRITAKLSQPPPGEHGVLRLLEVAEKHFAVSGFRATRIDELAKAAGISEAVIHTHFGHKESLFQQIVKDSVDKRLAALQRGLSLIPELPLVESIELMAEATVLACAGEGCNAALMAWALLEMREFATDVYRAEIGAIEVMWASEMAARFPNSAARRRLEVHLVPYASNACMAFGLWLATLRHTPATAQAHARQYAVGIAYAASDILNHESGFQKGVTADAKAPF